jgi:hypothetical protein
MAQIRGKQLKVNDVSLDRLVTGDAGQFVVAATVTGNFTAVSMSGDITLDHTGAASINDSAVDTAALAAGAVTFDRLSASAVATTITASTLTVPRTDAVKSYVDAAQAAAQSYADSVAQGLDVKQSVRLATTDGDLTGLLYSSGVLSESVPAQATLTVDQVSLALGDRVLVKNQINASENGIYEVTQVGDGSSVAWELTRAADFDSADNISAGAFCFVEEGTANADAGFVLSTDEAITLDTTSLDFTQFSGAGQVTAGNGLSKTGNTLDVNVDNSTIEISVDQLRLKDAGITAAKLSATVAGTGIAGGAGDALSLDLSELPSASVNVAEDLIAIVDLSAGSISATQSISGLMTAVAADGLAASAGELSIDLADASGLELSSGKLKAKAYSASSAFLPSVAVTDSGLIAAVAQVERTLSAATTGNAQTTGVSIAKDVAADSGVMVFVNGVAAHLSGDKLADCYFSSDSGATAKTLTSIAKDDVLYWNGTIAGFDLETTDLITVTYSGLNIPGGLTLG